MIAYLTLGLFELRFQLVKALLLLIRSRRYVPDHLYLIKYLIQLLKLAVPQTIRTGVEVLLPGHVPQPFVLKQT